MTDHELVQNVLAKKIKQVEGDIARLQKELGVLRSMDEKSTARKVGAIEDEVYTLTYELHRLERAAKALSPQTDESGQPRTLGELIKVLSLDKNRRAEGRRNALAQLAAEKERQRLSQPMQFADGQWDCPLLTPENVLRLKAEEDNGQKEDNEEG